MLALPSLRNFEVGLANGIFGRAGSDMKRWPKDSGWSSIERFSLLYSAIDSITIEILLKAPRALKEFCFCFGRIHMYEYQFTPQDLARALEPQKDTLEVLRVDFDDDWQHVGWERLCYNQLYFQDKLRSFIQLHVLKSSQQAVLGLLHDLEAGVALGSGVGILEPRDGTPRLAEILPETLKELHINYCDERVMSTLEGLSSALGVRGRLSKLANACCRVRRGDHHELVGM